MLEVPLPRTVMYVAFWPGALGLNPKLEGIRHQS